MKGEDSHNKNKSGKVHNLSQLKQIVNILLVYNVRYIYLYVKLVLKSLLKPYENHFYLYHIGISFLLLLETVKQKHL